MELREREREREDDTMDYPQGDVYQRAVYIARNFSELVAASYCIRQYREAFTNVREDCGRDNDVKNVHEAFENYYGCSLR